MPAIPESSPAVAPSVIAGLLLAASEHLARLGLAHPTVDEIVAATGAGRSSAYESRAKILHLLPSLAPRVGRPPAPPSSAPSAGSVTLEIARFVMDHPGCVHGSERRQYSEAFRKRVLHLHAQHPELAVEAFAEAAAVPAETLRDWMRVGAVALPAPAPAATAPASSPRSLQIETILAEWKTWQGGFVPFCEHVHDHLRVPLGHTAIGAILHAHGVRSPRRRSGEHSPDEVALRHSFQTFFAGAQWVADGTPVEVTFLGERFRFNLELEVDAHSAAFTGASIRDEEDGAALIESFEDGKATTGAPPLALLVDNRPSNLTPEVRGALGAETLLIPATPGRGQNKAHVEGAFGLFFQQAPRLVLSATTKREGARSLLELVVTTWARALNHRPRKDRNGKSRVDLYGEKPTPEQIEQARAALQERLRQQQLARATLHARQDPVVRHTLALAFARLGFQDPEGHLLDAIARYPLSAVVDGVGVFDGKRAAGTLPGGVDARYLLGIVRNISQEREATQISEAILRGRLEARDALLAPLVERKASLLKQGTDPPRLLASLVDHALATDRHLDRLFWLDAAADFIRHSSGDPAGLYRLATRRINATIRVGYVERLRATRLVASKVFPLE